MNGGSRTRSSSKSDTGFEPVEHGAHHIVVRDHRGYPVIEVSMGSDVLTAVVAPLVAAAGTVAALANDWSIEIE